MNITLTPFDKPFLNSVLRGSILALIVAGGLFFKELKECATDCNMHSIWVDVGEAFFIALGLRVGEGAIDQQNPVQREADTNK